MFSLIPEVQASGAAVRDAKSWQRCTEMKLLCRRVQQYMKCCCNCHGCQKLLITKTSTLR